VVEDQHSAVGMLRVWHNTRLAVGPHGAGMGNMAIGRHPLTMIEFNIAEAGLAFQDLAIALGFVVETFMPAGATQGNQMSVDVPRVVEAAVQALERHGATVPAVL
jgi:hypothetical protein